MLLELDFNLLVSLGFVGLGFLVDALGLLFDMLDFLLGSVCHFKGSLLLGHRCLHDLLGFFLDLLGFLLDLLGVLLDFLRFLLYLLGLFLGYLGFFLAALGSFFGSIAGASVAFSSLSSVFGASAGAGAASSVFLWLDLAANALKMPIRSSSSFRDG